MATQLGNVTKSLGREYNITVSSYSGKQLLELAEEGLDFRENSLIISSPVDGDMSLDTGTYALFATDGTGKPVRLTYTVEPGNGLVIDDKSDKTAVDDVVLKMTLDSDQITEGPGSISADENGYYIYVNKQNIIDEYTLTVNNPGRSNKFRGEIAVVTANLDKGTDTSYGICKGDEFTTYIDPEFPGQLKVNTQNLETVDAVSNRDGIVRHPSEMSYTVWAEDGILSVNTQNLDKTNENQYGVVKMSSTKPTIYSDELGYIYVNTQELERASDTKFGVVKTDDGDPNTPQTITSDNGVISVVTKNLEKAVQIENNDTNSGKFGIVKPDGKSVTASYGIISVNRFPEIEALLKTNNPEHEIFREDIEDLKNRVAKLETAAAAEEIELFIPVGETTTILPQPVWNKDKKQIDEYSDKKTIPFQVKTNCKFNVKVEYEFNENPQINLIYVKLGDGEQVPASNLGNHIFETTGKGASTLDLTFAIKNYNKDENIAFVNTQMIVTIASINDSAIKQSSFHIFKRWNNKAFIPKEEPDVDTPDKRIDGESRVFILPSCTPNGSENLLSLKGKSSEKSLEYNTKSSGNIYYNILGCKVFYNIDTTGNILTEQGSAFDFASQIELQEFGYKYNDQDHVTLSLSNSAWAKVKHTASFYNTKEFNTVTVEDTSTISQDRSIDVNIKYIPHVINLTNTNTTIDSSYKLEPINSNLTGADFERGDFGAILENIRSAYNAFGSVAILSKKTTSSTAIGQSFELYNLRNAIQSKYNSIYSKYNNDYLFNNEYKLNKSKVIVAQIKSLENQCVYELRQLINEFNLYIDIIEFIRTNQKTEETLTVQYSETIVKNMPRITLNANIDKNISYVQFSMSRTEKSIVSGDYWGVNVKYNFVNTSGLPVNTNGSTDNVIDYSTTLRTTKNSLSYDYNLNSEEITAAKSGVYTTTEQNIKYYDVVRIHFNIIGSAGGDWLLFGGKKDKIQYRAQKYSYDNNSISNNCKITDNVWIKLKANDGGLYYYNLKDATWNSTDKCYEMGIAEKGWKTHGIQGIASSQVGTYLNSVCIGNSYYSFVNKIDVTTVPNDARSTSYKKQRTVETKAVQTSTNIAGIKIKEVTVLDNSFLEQNACQPYTINDPGETITVIQSGSWVSSSISTGSYTFGNAKITNISISAWDDRSMIIKLTITPGTSTNIPIGSTITNIASSINGKVNFIFLKNSLSYEYGQFYNNYEFSSTSWNANGCVVTYRLFNNYSLSNTGFYTYKTILYNIENNTLMTVYTDREIQFTKSNTNRNSTYKNEALLSELTGIKLWVALGCQNITLTKNFYATLSNISDKILLNNVKFNVGTSKTVSIENANALSIKGINLDKVSGLTLTK